MSANGLKCSHLIIKKKYILEILTFIYVNAASEGYLIYSCLLLIMHDIQLSVAHYAGLYSCLLLTMQDYTAVCYSLCRLYMYSCLLLIMQDYIAVYYSICMIYCCLLLAICRVYNCYSLCRAYGCLFVTSFTGKCKSVK